MLTLTPQNIVASIIFVIGAGFVAVDTKTVGAKVLVTVAAVIMYMAAIMASRLRAPRQETINYVLHEWVVPAGILLVLVLLMAGITWNLYQE